MNARASVSLEELRRWRWLSQHALPVLTALLILAGLAYSGHVHEPQQARTSSAHCELCLQFDRLASTPAALVASACSLLLAWTMVTTATPEVIRLAPHTYHARGPPHA